jgi:hypothetical protein
MEDPGERIVYYVEIAAVILTVLGVGLSLLGRKPLVEFGAAPATSGAPYLIAFALIAIIFGLFTAIFFRLALFAHPEDVIFAIWLVIAMIGGMFAQVIAANYRARSELFSVSRDRLLYPLLFSVIVFYPIWALAASSAHGFFAIHAAFLNGYFWESIVSAAKPPTKKP